MENKPLKYKLSEKLIMNPTDKQKYLLLRRDLKFYMKHGMNVMKLQTVYQFSQSPWLAKCIKYNADQRGKAKTKYQKTSTN